MLVVGVIDGIANRRFFRSRVAEIAGNEADNVDREIRKQGEDSVEHGRVVDARTRIRNVNIED